MSLPCYNGGTCRDSYTNAGLTYICICPLFYTGARCEQLINPCASSPCVRGTCIPTIRNTSSTSSYYCQCPPGFTGLNCDIPIDQCTSSPCGPYGVCTSLATSYSCCCIFGYTGTQCTQMINFCTTNPCSAEGAQQCVSTVAGTFTCLCKTGYSGRYCEVNINECLSQPVRVRRCSSFLTNCITAMGVLYSVFEWWHLCRSGRRLSMPLPIGVRWHQLWSLARSVRGSSLPQWRQMYQQWHKTRMSMSTGLPG